MDLKMLCQGPCLETCFVRDQLFYLTLGAIIGYFITIYILKNQNKNQHT